MQNNPFKKGTQNHRILEALFSGPVTNTQIVAMRIFSYTRRISDLREKGFNVVGRPIREGLWQYELAGQGGDQC